MIPRNIEDIYPLSPMQAGMVFHTLNEPEMGAYVEQLRLTLEPLDVDRFRQAWTLMFERIPALRTSIAGMGRKEPVQVVRGRVELPWQEHDCSARAPADQDAWIAAYLERDRIRGFRLDEPSLVRLMLVRLAETRYELIWTLHHVALDGWSGALIWRDLFRIYQMLLRGEEPLLPPAPRFRDYIAWLQEQDMVAAEAYWRRALKGFEAPTFIDGGRSAPTVHSVANYAEESHPLSLALSTVLRESAATYQVTLNTLFQAAWALLLARYAKSDDVCFGAVVAGRPEALEGVEEMVGMLANTLPLRVQVPRDAPVDAWLAELQANQSERRNYEYSPLWQIQKWSGVPAGTRLFESLVAFENLHVAGGRPDAATDLAITATPPFDRTGYPLLLLIVPLQRLSMRLTYDADRFEQAEVRRILNVYQRLLRGLANPDIHSLSQIQWTDKTERTEVLVEFNQTKRAFPSQGCLHHLFEAQVDARPATPALAFGQKQQTYRQLEERANRLAHHLQALGVTPETPVALCLQRSFDMIVAVLGVLKAGGAYMPLDPNDPPARLAYLLDNAAVPVMITHDAASRALPPVESLDFTRVVVSLDHDNAEILAWPPSRPHSTVRSDNLAYILYTSGTTGRPKGVCMPHGPLSNLMQWQFNDSRVGAGQRTLQYAPLSFDVSCQEIFATLGAGGTLCLVDEDERRDPELLVRLLDEQAVARAFLPFVALQQLASAAEAAACFPRHLLEVITAGEQLHITPALRQLFKRLGGASILVNQYGPTESHVVSSFTLQGSPTDWPRLPPIGRPIANARLYLLDDGGEPVPIGMPGELYIGGACLSRGYVGDTAQTAAHFVEDPFSSSPGDLLYRTGDLGRFRADGNIDFLGRSDEQLKVRGFRVESSEVETALLCHPAVAQAAVVLREDRTDDRRLVAYIVVPEDTPTTNELRAFTAARLPGYMTPSAFVDVPMLPLTSSGKVDRRMLTTQRYAPPQQRTCYVAPRNGIEEALASIWGAVLGATDPGVYDNFFELGGHSLLATQVVSQARRAFDVDLTLRHLFEAPTISSLSETVDGLLWAKESRVDLEPTSGTSRERGHL